MIAKKIRAKFIFLRKTVIPMDEYLKMFFVFLFGAGGLAVINIIQERWKWRSDRRAKQEDKKEAREDKLEEVDKKLTDFIKEQKEYNDTLRKKQEEQDKALDAQKEALRYVLLDRILYIGQSYINRGEVSFDDRKRLREMHDCYHAKLGGNGDAIYIMNAVDELPLKAQ